MLLGSVYCGMYGGVGLELRPQAKSGQMRIIKQTQRRLAQGH
jgi:hypothetical protein